ncbi:hypothetical protein TKK_0001401 [Trichogramma kaykai]|uniref:Uncharacterized protein n=1 Tax=Trichogramma kaykai TaxID=54128 RepID=A0ABD2X313_9HYME
MTSNSSTIEDVDMDDVEFTLKDTFEHLMEERQERITQVKKLMEIIKNNEAKTIESNVTPAEIRRKRLKFVQSMTKIVSQEQPKDLPLPSTSDMYIDALTVLEKEVEKVEELNQIAKQENEELKKKLTELEKKKLAFEQIKEASLNAVDSETTSNYEAEMLTVKQIFQETKSDLIAVVDTLFPDNENFQDFLSILTRARTKGGDDLYIKVKPKYLEFAHFLDEADIVQFHPNQKNMCKLRDL